MKLLATPLSLLALLTSFATFSQTSLASVNNDLLKKTIIRSTEESQIHKMLLVAVKAADLEETLASVIPPPHRAWQSQRNAELESWALAPSRHVARLQEIRRPCDPRRGRDRAVYSIAGARNGS